MAARVGDESFVPFVPRQLIVPDTNGAQREAETNTNAGEESVADCQTSAEIESDADSIEQINTNPETSTIQAEALDVPTCRGPEKYCDHALEIRHEAIRLASIACGRALRHAVLLHPGVIAAFVDDAIAAAGLPQHARIRVHPDSIARIHASHHDRIGDDDLSPGDVVIECDGVSVGARLDTRARLLVAAAAES
jgi:hypothetical protein